MLFVKQELSSSWAEESLKPINLLKQEWEETNSIESNDVDWDKEFQMQMLELPPSEFFNSAAEHEQMFNGSCNQNGWAESKIRNHDCMWSGTCYDRSHPGIMMPEEGGQFPAASSANSTNTQETSAASKFNTVTAVAAASLNNNVSVTVKPNGIAKTAKTAQIPAGRSLLINPRNKQQTVNRVPHISTNDFLQARDTTVPIHARPDTPLSLEDDPPVFKHNIDLATCTVGSNRWRLASNFNGSSRQYAHHHNQNEESSHRIITMLKDHLEDMDSGSFRPCMTSSSSDIGSLTDLLNDLQEIQDNVDNDSQGEELDSDTDSSADGSSSRSSKGGGLTGGYTHAHYQDLSPPPSSSSSSSSSSPTSSSYEYQGTHVGDHSYTRPKNRCDLNGGPLTPSDSEEEIDVVSIGEKNLPTNPTARDRRALQSRVAHKIARKQAQSGGSQHHRRRHSDDEYSSHHHTGGSSSSSQTSPSKASSAYAFSPNHLTPPLSTSISGANSPLPGGGSSSSSISNIRKRPGSSKDERNGKNRHHQHRSKKQRIPGKKSHSDSSEEQETLEKRNLHNDMERQRRIGLKNLFEELKRQIPTLREKERAPKVNILREAATLCQRLNREQEQLNALRKQQQRLYARVRQLRTSLHSQRRME